MPSASAIRLQVESALAHLIPSALTPMPRVLRPVASKGVAAVDELLEGGLPIGAITEFVGLECSGRTSLALSFLAGITRRGSVGAWVDVSDGLDPESAAAAGVDLARLLWVRCGVLGSGISSKQIPPDEKDSFALPGQYLIPPPVKKGLHGGGFGPHPRTEVKGLSKAVGEFLRADAVAPRCAEPQRRIAPEREPVAPVSLAPAQRAASRYRHGKPWARIEQALRVTDLLLQAGGFAAIVLDMGGIAPEYATRVPLATWFRYRAAAERTQASLLLLAQHPCAKSSGELLLRFAAGHASGDEATVFTGMQHRVEVERRRFTQSPANVVSIRKPPQKETGANWRSRSTWAGAR